MTMYHRWIWPVVASVAAIVILTLDYALTEQPATRVGILAGIALSCLTAFVCLFSLRYYPRITPRVTGTQAAPNEGEMYFTLDVRGNTAAKPTDKEGQKELKARVGYIHAFAVYVLTKEPGEPGDVAELLAERTLVAAELRYAKLENVQLTRELEQSSALVAAAAVVTEANRGRTPQALPSPTSKRTAKKQRTKEKAPATQGIELQKYPDDGVCDWCEAGKREGESLRRLVRLYGVRRGRDGPDAIPVDMNVCRGCCENGLINDGNGSRTPPDTESGSNKVVLETAETS